MLQFSNPFGCKIIEESMERVVMETFISEDMLQPDGLLHGGMSAYLAETVASHASRIGIDPEKDQVLGLELSVSHLLPVEQGDTVRSVATAKRRGKHIQVWDIEQYRLSDGKLFNTSRLTTFAKDVEKDGRCGNC